MTIKVGLIGLGKIGATYDLHNGNLVSHLKTILSDERFKLEFGYDPSLTQCNKVIKKYELVNIYNEVSDIKKACKDIDILIVASPTDSHLNSIETFTNFLNPKILVCEKPIAGNLKDSQKIKSLCDEKDILLFCNFMRRSLPEFINLKKNINDSSEIFYDVIIKYSGCFKNNGAHFIDFMNFVFGKPIRIISRYSEVSKRKLTRARASIEYENAVCTLVPLKSDKVTDHEIQILSDNSKIIITRAGRSMQTFLISNDHDFLDSKEYLKTKDIDTDYLMFQKHVYNDLYNAYTSDTIPYNLCDGDEAIFNVQFMEKIIK